MSDCLWLPGSTARHLPPFLKQDLTAEDADQLRTLLWEGCLLQKAAVYAPFVTNKLVKVAVDVAVLTWASAGHGLLGDIAKLLQQHDSTAVALGLAVLETLCEECTGSPPPILSSGLVTSDSASAVRRQLSDQLSTFGVALSAVLQQAASGSYSGAALSPSAGQSPTKATSSQGMFGGQPGAAAVNQSLTKRALSCLGLTISEWRLGEHVQLSALNTVFALVSAGLQASHTASSQSAVTVAAVNVVVDVVRTSSVPSHFQGLFGDVAMQMLRGVEALLGAHPSAPASRMLQMLPDEIVGKFAEFVGVFLQFHVGRLSDLARFSLPDFVRVFFSFTVALADVSSFSADAYLSCLQGWSALVDHFTASPAGTSSPTGGEAAVYMSAISSLATQLLDRVQFAKNGELLSMLDDGDAAEDRSSVAGSTSTTATMGSVLPALPGRAMLGAGAGTPPRQPPTAGAPSRGAASRIGASGTGSAGNSIFGDLLWEPDELEEGGWDESGRATDDTDGGSGTVQVLQRVLPPSSTLGRSDLDEYIYQCLLLLARIGRLPAVTQALVSAVLTRLQETAATTRAAVESSTTVEEDAQWNVYDTSTLCGLTATLAHVWTSHSVSASAAAQATAGQVLQLTAALGASVSRALQHRASSAGAACLPQHLLHRLQRSCFTCLLAMLPWLDLHLPSTSAVVEACLSDATADAVLSDILTLVVAAVDSRGAVSPPSDSTIASAVTLFTALTERSQAFTQRLLRLPLAKSLVQSLPELSAALPTDAQAHLLAAVCKLLVQGGSADGLLTLEQLLRSYTSPLQKLAAPAASAEGQDLTVAVAADRSLPSQLKRMCTILLAVCRGLAGVPDSLRSSLRELFSPLVSVLVKVTAVLLSPATSAALMTRRGHAPTAPAAIAVSCLNAAAASLRFIGCFLDCIGSGDRSWPGSITRTIAQPMSVALTSGLLVPARHGTAHAARGSSHSATRVLLEFMRLMRHCCSVVEGKAASSELCTLVLEAMGPTGLAALVEQGQAPQAPPVAPHSRDPHADLSPALHLLVRQVLEQHWRVFAVSKAEAGGQEAGFRSADAAGQVEGMVSLVLASMAAPGLAPSLLRLHLATLRRMQVKQRAFSLPPMRVSILPRVLTLLLRLLLQGEHTLLTDELHSTLWCLVTAAEQPEAATLACLQGVLADMRWLRPQHVAALEGKAAQVVAAARQGGSSDFRQGLDNICADLRVWGSSVAAAAEHR